MNSRIHETDFCAQVASATNDIVNEDPSAFPFREARIEGYGTGASRTKRKDLRLADSTGRLVLCGEVKMPGTSAGRSPMDHELVTHAAAKADDAGTQYFFTWNVNEFALWDRSLWNRPWYERRVRLWSLPVRLSTAEEVGRQENLDLVKSRFWPDLLRDLGEIISGHKTDWGLPPDDLSIRSLESHLAWPVQLARTYLLRRSAEDAVFDGSLQQWMVDQDWSFVRANDENWRSAVENMARTIAYVWSNRLIFYQALRARFPNLPKLELMDSVRSATDTVATFDQFFSQAVDTSGDYEPLLMPETADWATELVFEPHGALAAWRGLLTGIEAVDFSTVPSDVVGRIFQKLIGPEERHRYGQHFAGDDVGGAACGPSRESIVSRPHGVLRQGQRSRGAMFHDGTSGACTSTRGGWGGWEGEGATERTGENPCERRVDATMDEVMARIREGVEGRATNAGVQRKVLDLLRLWYVRGR